jgi:ketosteroid isomerase-like protein
MSQENVETVRAAVSAFDQRDEAAWLALCHPKVELLDELSLSRSVYRGLDAVGAWFRAWEKVWEDVSVSGLEVLREQGDLVVWRITARARGRLSGVEVAQDFWHVTRLRDGRFIRIENHRSEADALEAAGLRE